MTLMPWIQAGLAGFACSGLAAIFAKVKPMDSLKFSIPIGLITAGLAWLIYP